MRQVSNLVRVTTVHGCTVVVYGVQAVLSMADSNGVPVVTVIFSSPIVIAVTEVSCFKTGEPISVGLCGGSEHRLLRLLFPEHEKVVEETHYVPKPTVAN